MTGAVLLVQFLLGIHVNLYVKTAPVGGHASGGMMGGGMMGGGFMKAMSRAMSGSSTLMLHMMMGWLLVILAVAALLAALLVRRKDAIALSALGFVAIVVAGYGGLQFMISGHDAYSYLMATGFVVAMGAYFGEGFVSRTTGRRRFTAPSDHSVRAASLFIDAPDWMPLSSAVNVQGGILAGAHPGDAARMLLGSDSIPSVLELRASEGRGALTVHAHETRRLTSADLLRASRDGARGLAASGVQPGDRVGILGRTAASWLVSALSVWEAGATVVGLPHPLRIVDRAALRQRLESLLTAARCSLVLASEEFTGDLPPVLTVDWGRLEQSPADSERGPGARREDAAVIQFTSGSTTKPRGVLLTHGAVLSYLTSVLLMEADAPYTPVPLSWMPLFHDWGLFAYFLRPLLGGFEGHLLPTEAFAQRPRSWAEALTRTGATDTSGPPGAWAILARVLEREPSGLDLSQLRWALIGAEGVDPTVVERLVSAGKGVGLHPEVVGSGYGLAEVTLGVTSTRPGEGVRILEVDRDPLVDGTVRPRSGRGTRRIVSAGPPMPGVEVVILEDERPVEEGRVGEIAVRSPSTMQGFVIAGSDSLDPGPRFEGWTLTGDLGFVHAGELFVSGRRKDVIIALGRNHYPEDVEWAAQTVRGVRGGGAAAFSSDEGLNPKLVLVVESDRSADREFLDEVYRACRDRAELAPDEIIVVPPHTLPKTTSGKLQRHLVKAAYREGVLPG